MRTVFADAGYWIALLGYDAQLLNRAASFANQRGAFRIVTSHMVLVEVLAHVSRGGDLTRSRAISLVKELQERDDVEVIPQTEAQFEAALERYAARLDQDWSLTDCASFLTMEARGIQEALAYDSDFVQAGFTALLRD